MITEILIGIGVDIGLGLLFIIGKKLFLAVRGYYRRSKGIYIKSDHKDDQSTEPINKKEIDDEVQKAVDKLIPSLAEQIKNVGNDYKSKSTDNQLIEPLPRWEAERRMMALAEDQKKEAFWASNEPYTGFTGTCGITVQDIATSTPNSNKQPTSYEKFLDGVAKVADNENDKKLIDWYRRQMEKLNIEIKFNTEVNDIATINADEIVIATGSSTRKLRIPGAERTIDAVEYLLGEKEVGKNVVVIGGGLTGCEVAYDLFLKGKNPVIVETKNDLMAVPGICLANSSYLRDFFNWKKVPVYLESTCTEIKENAVVVKTANGEEEVKADSVILAIGYNPNPIAEESKNVHIVGDANKIGNLRTVIWRAWDVAKKF